MSSYFDTSSDATRPESRLLDDEPAKLSLSPGLTPNSAQDEKHSKTKASPMRPIVSRSPERHIPNHAIHYKMQDGTAAVLSSGCVLLRSSHATHLPTQNNNNSPRNHRNWRLLLEEVKYGRESATFCCAPNDQIWKRQYESTEV